MVVRFQAVTPQLYDPKQFFVELNKAAREIGQGMLKDFEKTTKGWETDVQFYIRTHVGSNRVEVIVGTDNEIYGYVDEGTRPHIITPTRATVLRFQPGYRPATTPGRLTSRRARRSGDPVYAQRVNHPGTEAREFSKLIVKRWEAKAYKIWLKAFERASRV